jgi:hypothetical protein
MGPGEGEEAPAGDLPGLPACQLLVVCCGEPGTGLGGAEL